MITVKINAEVFKEGHYFNGEANFTFNVKIEATKTGFEWELEVPEQSPIVIGTKYNQETGEDDEFTIITHIDPIRYSIKLRNKDAISSGEFNIEQIKINPKSKTLDIEFN